MNDIQQSVYWTMLKSSMRKDSESFSRRKSTRKMIRAWLKLWRIFSQNVSIPVSSQILSLSFIKTSLCFIFADNVNRNGKNDIIEYLKSLGGSPFLNGFHSRGIHWSLTCLNFSYGSQNMLPTFFWSTNIKAVNHTKMIIFSTYRSCRLKKI